MNAKITPPVGYKSVTPLQKTQRVVLPRESSLPEFARSIHALPVSFSEIAPDASIGTLLAWDSMNHLHLILAIEKSFGTKFRPDQLRSLISVQAIKEALAEKGVDRCRS